MIQKNPKTRSDKDVKKISKYLEKTQLISQYLSIFQDHGELAKSIMKIFSLNLKYEFIEKDKILFKQGIILIYIFLNFLIYLGEIEDKFFIILEGSLKRIQYREYETYMDLQQYIDHLERLNEKGDMTNIKLTLQANKENNLIFVESQNNEIYLKFKEKLHNKIFFKLIGGNSESIYLLGDHKKKENQKSSIQSKCLTEKNKITNSQFSLISKSSPYPVNAIDSLQECNKTFRVILYDDIFSNFLYQGNLIGDFDMKTNDIFRYIDIYQENIQL